jgi:protein translocase SecG subunit
MQSAKKEGISGVVGGASETFFGKNKGKTLDAKFALVTTICAIIFLISSLFLSYGLLAVEKAEAPKQEVSDYVDLGTEEVEPETEETPAE